MTDGPATTTTTGRTASSMLPLWVLSLDWELRRGRQVVLHGEVNDRFWLDGRPASFRELLTDYLLTMGAEIVGWWDPVDGLTFPDDGHEDRFRRALAGQHGTARPPASPGPDDSGHDDSGPHDSGPDDSTRAEQAAAPENGSAGDLADAGGDQPAGTGLSTRRAQITASRERVAAVPAPRMTTIHDVLGAVRRVASQSEIASAFVLRDIDAVLRPENEETATEYLRLRAAMNEATVARTRLGEPPHARNPVLVVVGDAGRLPAWFCAEDPRVRTLRVARPDAAERRLWLSMLRSGFNSADGAADLEPLVGATEGLAAWHIDALARTSVIRKVPARKVTRLLDAYHFNVRTNPWTQLDAKMVASSGAALGGRVIGQDAAVEAVARALQTAYAGVDYGSSGAGRPRGVFFFVGPTGVGKTELAKAVAALVFGDESALARFDMSEYAQEHAAERLAGAPPGYVGYERGGELTRRVQERPFSVLLFDEIEKANTAVLDKFLQILEDGRLTDGRGETANFSQSLIIFTSNMGTASLPRLLADAPSDAPVGYDEIEKHFQHEVEKTFRETIGRPEIYGRLKPGVVVFDMLRPRHVAGITRRLVGQLAESVLERHAVTLVIDTDAVLAWVEDRMKDPENLSLGGRQIRNELERLRTAYVSYYVARQPVAGEVLRLTVDQAGNFTVGPAAAGGA